MISKLVALVSTLSGLAIILTALNVSVIGGFIGKAETLHPDIGSIKERGAARAVVFVNGLILLSLLAFILGYSFYAGITSYSDYVKKNGCQV